MPDEFGLPEDTLRRIKEVFSQFQEIEQVKVYGSRAMGNYKQSSDIDLALLGDQVDFATVSRVAGALDELPTPYLFDITPYRLTKHQELLDHINAYGKVLYKKSH